MADPRPMTRNEMERLGALLFGYGWKSRLADALDVNRREVSRWIAADNVAPWAADRLRAMVAIAPPPGSSDHYDRDLACRDALEPEMTRLRDLAVSAGWHPAEIAAAVLSMTVDEIRHHAGHDALMETLSSIAAGSKPTPRSP